MRVLVAFLLLAIVLFVAAQSKSENRSGRRLRNADSFKDKLVRKVADRLRGKLAERPNRFKNVLSRKFPLQEQIEKLQNRLKGLKAKLVSRSRRPQRGGEEKPRSRGSRGSRGERSERSSRNRGSRGSRGGERSERSSRSRPSRSSSSSSRGGRSSGRSSSRRRSASTESDAEFLKKLGKIAQKVLPVAQKALQVYTKVKSFGILADQEKAAETKPAPAKSKLGSFFSNIAQKLREKFQARKSKSSAPAKKDTKKEQPKKVQRPKFGAALKPLKEKLLAVLKNKGSLLSNIAQKLKEKFAKKGTKTSAPAKKDAAEKKEKKDKKAPAKKSAKPVIGNKKPAVPKGPKVKALVEQFEKKAAAAKKAPAKKD